MLAGVVPVRDIIGNGKGIHFLLIVRRAARVSIQMPDGQPNHRTNINVPAGWQITVPTYQTCSIATMLSILVGLYAAWIRYITHLTRQLNTVCPIPN